jgi:hypothetical protein
LGGTLRHLVLGFVEGGCGLRKSALGLGDDLLGAGDSGVRIRKFLGGLIAPGETAANSRRADVRSAFATSRGRSRAIMIRPAKGYGSVVHQENG